MNKLAFFGMALALSCQNFSSRAPSSFDPLHDLMARIEEHSAIGVASHQECYEETGKYYQHFFSLTAEETNLQHYGPVQLQGLVQKSFNSRLNIRKRLDKFDPEDPDAQRCLSSVRSLTRALRYFEDYAVELLESSRGGEGYTALDGDGSHFLKNPKFLFRNYKDLRSGDIILSRGNAYSSAAIARIGSMDAQFSHLSFVYKDEEGRLHTTEAHIEIGSFVAPLEKHIESGNAREVVFRYKDPVVAHNAAKFIYEKVKKHSEDFGNIQYDFSMNYKDNEKLFCSEIIYDGFLSTTQGQLEIPLFKTKFSAGLIPFLRNIGIEINDSNAHDFDTFAPGDIEFDGRFELVAEWRRPNRLRDNRMKDAVLTKVFEWMETKSYRFKPSFVMSLKSYSAWILRRTPFIKKKLEKKFPLNMTTRQLNTFLLLDEVGEKLYEKLQSEQDKVSGPLSFKEMFHILEEFRFEDELRPRKKSLFHNRFHPDSPVK